MAKPTLADKLVVAISSRALFDLSESHRIFTEQGVDAYQRYQIEHEDELLAPGPAFTLVKKLLRLNRPDKQYVEVILLSRNSADTGLRVFNAIKHYGLDISRAAFTKGELMALSPSTRRLLSAQFETSEKSLTCLDRTGARIEWGASPFLK